jgi:hypothetical protein
MKKLVSWRGVASLVLGSSLCASMGCQTWVGGMTLPSPHYLRDSPDYLTPAHSFPLRHELAAQQAAAGGVAVPAAAHLAPAAPPAPAAMP